MTVHLFTASLHWRPLFGPAATGGIVLLVVAWIAFIYFRLAKQVGPGRGARLIAPKAAAFALILLAIFDPAWGLSETRGERLRVLALLDASSSMDVEDAEEGSRKTRALALLERMQQELDADVDLQIVPFDVEHHAPDAEEPDQTAIRGTDLGRCLVSAAELPDIEAKAAVLLFTDGGDEHVTIAKMPHAPLYVLGLGTPPSEWNDVMLADVDAPAVVEQNSEFSIQADIKVYDNGGFEDDLSAVQVYLERQESGDPQSAVWKNVPTGRGNGSSGTLANLSDHRARISFAVPGDSALGMVQYRIRIQTLAGELTDLNNIREFAVEVQKKSLRVLLLTRSLGWDVNNIRKTLDRDSGVALMAMTRLTGERYLIQGDRHESDKAIERGFPTDPDVLELYKCIIIGSLPVSDWTQQQQDALKSYVQRGGAVVFLGGDQSFGLGGYGGTPLAPLFPWAITNNEKELAAGDFPIGLTPATGKQDLLTGFSGAMAAAGDLSLASVNQPGPLRPGAISLLEASIYNRTAAVIALQPYGQGQILGIASNTMWRWSKSSNAGKAAYGVFWRQVIRHLADVGDSGRFVSLKWDKARYRAGEQAEIAIQVAGRYSPGQLRVKATVTQGEETTPLRLDPTSGRAGGFTTAVFFPDRGEYTLVLDLAAGETKLEQFTKVVRVGPAVNEGAELPVDHAFLEQLANQSHGTYAPEADVRDLITALHGQVARKAITIDTPLTEKYGIFVVLFLMLLIIEWIMRRKLNLI